MKKSAVYRCLWRFLGIVVLIVAALVVLMSFLDVPFLSGKVVLSLDRVYSPGEVITGAFVMTLEPGELLSKQTEVVVTLGGQEERATLESLLGSSSFSSGDFYVRGFSFDGFGTGYGSLGEKEVSPEVTFSLLVAGEETVSAPSDPSDEVVGNVSVGNVSLGNEGVGNLSEENESVGNVSLGNESVGNLSEGNVTDGNVTLGNVTLEDEESEDEVGNESSPEVETNESEGESEDESVEESEGEGSADEVSQDDDVSLDDGGNGTSLLTGQAVSEYSHEVEGSVTKGGVFTYALEEGQGALLKEGSVAVHGLPVGADVLMLEVVDNELRVTTSYTEMIEGYGKEYVFGEDVSFRVDLASFNLTAVNDSVLQASLVYLDEELLTVEEGVTVSSGLVNETLGLLADLVNGTNETLEEHHLLFLEDISLQRLAPGEASQINLSQHFEGAERYTLEVANVSASFLDGLLLLEPDEGFRGSRRGKVVAYAGDHSVESNVFTLLVSSGAVRLEAGHQPIRLGEKVRWEQNVSLEIPEEVLVELPAVAENVSVREVVDGVSTVLTGNVVHGFLSAELDLEKEPRLVEWLRGLFGSVTGRIVTELEGEGKSEHVEVVLEEEATEYVISYETPAPSSTEVLIDAGKQVVISGPDELNYTNVLSFAGIPELLSVGQESQMVVHWVEGGADVGFDVYDLDGNGMLDYVEWITPHLSEQTFNVILITDAAHLNGNRTFLSNIYDEVKSKDGVFSEGIPVGDYVRVWFEHNLTSVNDITVYARGTGGVGLEVLEVNGSEVLETFPEINEFDKYQIFLTSLNGSADAFDLRVTGDAGEIEFDYIVDPVACAAGGCLYIENVTGDRLAVFDNGGNIDLAGALSESSPSSPDSASFIVSVSGTPVAWIDGDTGNMEIVGSSSQDQGSYCTPPTEAFVVTDAAGNCVTYIDTTGNLWMRASLGQGVGF